MNTYKYKEIETGNNVKEEKNEKGRRDTIEDNEDMVISSFFMFYNCALAAVVWYSVSYR